MEIISYKKNFKLYIKNGLICILVFALMAEIILNSSYISKGIILSSKYCLEILIPSLFPFMFLSRFVIASEMLSFLKKPLNKITKFIFYLPGACAPAIFLSLIGGYPIGATGAKTLIENKEINSEQLNRMLSFSVNAGPAFFIDIVGRTILKNNFLGITVFIIQVCISIFLGIILGIISRIKKIPYYSKNENKGKNKTLSESIIKSTSETSISIINMCSLILVFNVVISVLEKFLTVKNEFYILIISCLEITSGCMQAEKIHASLPLICFCLAYSGICTHLQISSILSGEKFNYKKFQLFRILNATLLYLASYMFLKFFKCETQVFFSSKNVGSPSISSTILGSSFLLILCIYFIVEQNKIFLNKK